MARARTQKRGMGTLFKKPNGYYCYQYTASGRKITHSLKTRDRKEAEAAAEQYFKLADTKTATEAMERIASARRLTAEMDKPKLALSDVWAAFLETKPDCSAGTLENHRRHWRAFVNWMSENHPLAKELANVEADHAGDWLNTLKGTVSVATWNDYRTSCSGVVGALLTKYKLASNPFITVKAIKRGESQRRLALPPAGVRAFVELLDGESWPYREEFKGAGLAMLYAGMRLSDAVALRRQDVDFTAGIINYMPRKTQSTGRRAELKLFPPLRAALEALPPDPDGLFFPRLAEHYARNPDYVKRAFIAAVQQAAGSDGREINARAAGKAKIHRAAFGAHSLRHSFASYAAAGGCEPAKLAAMLGDNPATVGKYYISSSVATRPIIAEGFESVKKMTAGQLADPDRQRLTELAAILPIETIKTILKELEHEEYVKA